MDLRLYKECFVALFTICNVCKVLIVNVRARVKRALHKLKKERPCKIRRTARLSSEELIIYALQSKVIYASRCTELQAENEHDKEKREKG